MYFSFMFVFFFMIYFSNSWVDVMKFMIGVLVVGSIVMLIILKYVGVIGWGVMVMELLFFLVFVMVILCYFGMNDDDGYSMFWSMEFLLVMSWFF